MLGGERLKERCILKRCILSGRLETAWGEKPRGTKKRMYFKAVSKNATMPSVSSSTQGVLVKLSGAAHQLLIWSLGRKTKGTQCDLTGCSSHDYDGWDNVNSSQLIIDRLLLERYDKNKDATLHLSPPAKPSDLSHATGATERCDGAALSRGKTSDPVWKRYASKINVFWWKPRKRAEEEVAFPSASDFLSIDCLRRRSLSVVTINRWCCG